MKTGQRFLFTTLLTALLTSVTMQAAEKGWVSFNDGIKKAKLEKKFVLVDFYTDWCHWCKVMDQKTFQDPAVAKKLQQSFVTVRLNPEKKGESVTFKDKTYTNAEFTQAFGVTGYPSLAFLDAQGNVITMVPGYVEAKEFIQILEFIDQRCYEKQVSFEDFKKSGSCKTKKS